MDKKLKSAASEGLFAGPRGKKVLITGDPLVPLLTRLDPRAPTEGPVGRGDDPATLLPEPMGDNPVLTPRRP